MEISTYNIGDKIYPIDFSYFSYKRNGKNVYKKLYDKIDQITEQLNKGIPLIVVSKPYTKKNNDSYFIDVTFDNIEIYSIIINCLICNNYIEYIENLKRLKEIDKRI